MDRAGESAPPSRTSRRAPQRCAMRVEPGSHDGWRSVQRRLKRVRGPTVRKLNARKPQYIHRAHLCGGVHCRAALARMRAEHRGSPSFWRAASAASAHCQCRQHAARLQAQPQAPTLPAGERYQALSAAEAGVFQLGSVPQRGRLEARRWPTWWWPDAHSWNHENRAILRAAIIGPAQKKHII